MKGVSQQIQDLKKLALDMSRSVLNTLYLITQARRTLYTIMQNVRTSRNKAPDPKTVLTPTNSQESDTTQSSRTNVPSTINEPSTSKLATSAETTAQKPSSNSDAISQCLQSHQ
ncbi:PREDICTED: uncharacterized protein LOC105461379, partial [Wasmannia auropunctata]|uniref:uncharacterized protein LOC105461379 n=1 Tax=Wasmannia auropunctata TaxID=64793 RepID=UPI0005EDA692